MKDKERPKDGYWIIPPEIYDPLNKLLGKVYK